MELADVPNTYSLTIKCRLWLWNSPSDIGTQQFSLSLKIQFIELTQDQLNPQVLTQKNQIDSYVNVITAL
jgi:hypothetical protein